MINAVLSPPCQWPASGQIRPRALKFARVVTVAWLRASGSPCTFVPVTVPSARRLGAESRAARLAPQELSTPSRPLLVADEFRLQVRRTFSRGSAVCCNYPAQAMCVLFSRVPKDCLEKSVCVVLESPKGPSRAVVSRRVGREWARSSTSCTCTSQSNNWPPLLPRSVQPCTVGAQTACGACDCKRKEAQSRFRRTT
jgi:hypothetical protein